MAEEETEEKSKKSPLILFIIIGVLLVGGSIGGTIFFLQGDDGAEEEELVEPDPEAIYFSLNPKFKTNYDVDGRPRLFQVAITLVTREEDVIEALGQHSPTIKSKLVILISGQKFDELQTPEGREALRKLSLKAVQDIMNKEIGKPGVEKVLFTDFVMQ